MDPTACVQRILDALGDEDYEEAYHAAEDLMGWLGASGFPPALDNQTCRIVLAHIMPALLRAWMEQEEIDEEARPYEDWEDYENRND